MSNLQTAGQPPKPGLASTLEDPQASRIGALPVRLAIGLALLYAVPHVWWGFGVDWLAPADMGGDEGLGSHPAIRAFAFYGMGVLAVFSAVLARPLMDTVNRSRFPNWFLGLHGWGIGILLLIRGGIGLVETSLVLTGARDCPFLGCRSGNPGRDSIGLTGSFWEPLFVVWGVALLAAVIGWRRARTRP